jgi:hypothetical protein
MTRKADAAETPRPPRRHVLGAAGAALCCESMRMNCWVTVGQGEWEAVVLQAWDGSNTTLAGSKSGSGFRKKHW